MFRETSPPFDAQAQQDFKQVKRSITAINFKIHRIRDIKYSPLGAIVGATFTVKGAPTYVYAPDYKALPEDLPNELKHIAINQDWYFSRITNWN